MFLCLKVANIWEQLVYSVLETNIFLSLYYHLIDIVNIKTLSSNFFSNTTYSSAHLSFFSASTVLCFVKCFVWGFLRFLSLFCEMLFSMSAPVFWPLWATVWFLLCNQPIIHAQAGHLIYGASIMHGWMIYRLWHEFEVTHCEIKLKLTFQKWLNVSWKK